MTTTNDFAELLQRIRQGDREALGALLNHYEPALRRFARAHLGRTLRPHADSIDLVQSVHKSLMIALWSNRYEFAGPEKLLALGGTILARKVARLAAHVRRQQRSDPVPASTDSHTGGILQCLPSTETDPAEAAQFDNSLEHVCRQLNERERHILNMLLQGRTRKEIAEALGEEPHAFRVYWGRVMKRLRESGALNTLLEPVS